MPDVLIKDVEAEDKELLRIQAARNRRSMQEELRIIIHEGVNPSPNTSWYSSLKETLQGLEEDGFTLPARQTPKAPIQFE